MKRTIRTLAFIALVLLGVPLALNALSYGNLDVTYGFLRLKAKAIETGWYLPAYYAHVLFAGIILLVGMLQVHRGLRRRFTGLHRLLGKIYVGGIIFFAAPGGLIMSFFIQRGPWVLTSFLLQTVAWVFCTYHAYVFIRQGNIAMHRRWMWRSYAITLAAITLRLYAFMTSWSLDLTHPVAYAVIAWASWVGNLLVCELLLNATDSKKAAPDLRPRV
jgi:uncharacterized membrane protein